MKELSNSESKGMRLEVGWEAGSLPLWNFPRIPEQVKSEWQCVRKTTKKKAWSSEVEKKYREENFNLMFGLF